jgi:phosphoribosylanthranilate isomerase
LSRVRVKICGLTRARDVRAALAAGADAVGFVFASSKRRIDPGSARDLALLAGDRAVRVGLFMNQQADAIHEVLETVPLDLLQFHGSESNRFCRRFGMPFIKAVPMGDAAAAREALAYPDAAGLLLDSHASGAAGGTGVAFDWALIPECPHPVWLAGGLHAGNVAEAIRRVRPWAVDVSSGVEQAPGIKSGPKIEAFMRAVASALPNDPD